jgi:hypothetical protein
MPSNEQSKSDVVLDQNNYCVYISYLLLFFIN